MSTRRHSRREFVGFAGAGLAGLASAPWQGAPAAPSAADARNADLVVVNAKVYTVEAATPRVEAFAVKGGRFAAVGTTAMS